MPEFSEKYLKHFTAPQNIGEIIPPDGFSEAAHEGGGCFDRIKMTIKVENGILTDIRYKLRACSGTIAASSAVTFLAKGKTLDEASLIDFDAVNEELGIVPERKHHSVELAIKAFHEAVSDFQKRGSN